MDWSSGDRSNIEDRRGSRMGGRTVPLSIGGVVLLVLVSWLTGTDPLTLLNGGDSDDNVSARVRVRSRVLRAKNARWISWMPWPTTCRTCGRRFWAIDTNARRSWCSGTPPTRRAAWAQSATGPFYCPEDRKVYLDLSFFDELSQRFGAPGDFARAYVIAHEFGASRATPHRPGCERAWRRHRSEQRVGGARTPSGLLRRRLGPRRFAATVRDARSCGCALGRCG